MDGTARAEGLRERKKRQTRQLISDVATGLFVERGFERVTVAEIAEAAEVSVNTVYNYFPAKEDLFFDREAEVVERLSRVVRERRAGESAARAVLRVLREEVAGRSPQIGLIEGFERFMAVLHSTPSLTARLWRMQQLGADDLARTLAAETGAAPGDPLPELVADLLSGVQETVFRTVGRAIAGGAGTDRAAAEALARLDAVEPLLGEKLLNYAVRSAE